MNCPSCGHQVLDIDVKCGTCGHPLGATGAQRMLGQVVLGQYELIDVLGQGGMSVVFKGKHKMTDQEVALKILPPELAAHSQVKSRFLEEAKALAALDHPNIVHLYNFGQENGLFVLAMQFVQGRTWERMILERTRLDWQTSVKITVDVLRALEYAHGRGVVHRDMKPSNVLVRSHDGMATVMDFGIAKMTTSTKLTATGQTMGTVRYMSPEQVRGQDVDLRTDLYSLGATLYESLTGDTPFDGTTHFEIMTKHLSEAAKRPSSRGIEVPRLVEDALMRCLMKKPDDRFADAREMRKVLEGALKEGDVGLSQTARLAADLSATPPARAATPLAADLADQLEPGLTGAATSIKASRRSRVPLFVALALVLAAGAVATVLVLRGGQTPAGYQPATTDIEGVVPVTGAKIDNVLIETTGILKPPQVAEAYKASVAKVKAAARAAGVPFAEHIQLIVAVQPGAFCKTSAYPDGRLPDKCGELIMSVKLSSKGVKRALVIDDPALVGKALDLAVAEAMTKFSVEDGAVFDKQLELSKRLHDEYMGIGTGSAD